MTRTIPPYICLAALAWACFGGAGCRSSLTIDVDVYTGPLVESYQTRISRSVGLARSMRDVARRAAGQQYSRADQGLPAFYVRRNKDDVHSITAPRRRGAFDLNLLGAPNADFVAIGPDGTDLPHESLAKKVYLNKHASAAQLLGELAQAYDDWEIDTLYEDYLEQGGPQHPRYEWPNDNDNGLAWADDDNDDDNDNDDDDGGNDDNLDDLEKLHGKLLSRLLSFSDAAAAIAAYLGLPEGAKLFLVDDQLLFASLMLDESARILRIQLDSIHHAWNAYDVSGGDAREIGLQLAAMSEISAVMASQAPGTLLTAARQAIGGGGYISQVFDDIYWKNINTVRVKGSGDVKVLVVKDEIGNWHLKKAVVDPSKVINAIQEVGIAAVKIAANAYGVPIPIGQSAAPDDGGTPTPPEDNQTDAGGKAKESLEQLHDKLTQLGPTPTKEEVLKAISDALAGL